MLGEATLFYVLALTLSGVLGFIQQSSVTFKDIGLAAISPALAIILLLMFSKGLDIPINYKFDSSLGQKYFLSLVIPLVISLLSYLVCSRVLGFAVEWPGEGHISLVAILSTLGILFIGALGEELGWRGYLQPLLETELSMVVSAVMAGVLWGIWHISYYQYGLSFMAGFTLFTIGASVILGVLLSSDDYNLLAAVIFHIFINVGFVLFFKDIFTDPKAMLTNGVVWLVIAFLSVLVKGGDFVKGVS